MSPDLNTLFTQSSVVHLNQHMVHAFSVPFLGDFLVQNVKNIFL